MKYTYVVNAVMLVSDVHHVFAKSGLQHGNLYCVHTNLKLYLKGV